MSQVPASIADVHNNPDERRIPVDKVGIKNIRHPIRVTDRDNNPQHTVGSFSMFVDLPHDVRGTHMSRFVEILNGRDHEISVASLEQLLTEVKQALHSESVHIEVAFPFFVEKRAPVSGVSSLLDYNVALFGDIAKQGVQRTVKVLIPVTSLCPCSKQISDYGAHNQRSHVTVTAHISGPVWIRDIIDLVEQEASCEIYGLIKRPDEKYITERAYDNPKFVEDMVRDVAARLSAHPHITAFNVESENFESIHNHSAYALIEQKNPSA